jgi:hypothetical protein
MKNGLMRMRIEYENNKIVDVTSKDPDDLEQGFSLMKRKLFGGK